MYMCRIMRGRGDAGGAAWRLKTVGWSGRGRTYQDCVAMVSAEVRGARRNTTGEGHEYTPAPADLFRPSHAYPAGALLAQLQRSGLMGVLVALACMLLLYALLTSGQGGHSPPRITRR